MANKFEHLRLPGILSHVSRNYRSEKIHSQGIRSISISIDEIDPGKFAFGFAVSTTEGFFSAIPGELSGYFATETNARLYALEYIREKAQGLTEDMIYSIDVAISKLRDIPLPLFDDL